MPRKKRKRRLTHRKVGDLDHYRIGDDYEMVQGKDFDTLKWEEDKFLIPKPDTIKKLGLGAAGASFFVHLGKRQSSPILVSRTPISGEQLKGIAKGVSGSVGYTVEPQTINVIGQCPKCGAPLLSPTNYCPDCGKKLQD